jgi:RNA polymerase sigma-70 factor (ECF subfamily)
MDEHDVLAERFQAHRARLRAVAYRVLAFARFARVILPAVIDGAFGVVTAAEGRPITLTAFTITGGKIAAIDVVDDHRGIAEADLAILGR